MPVLIAILSLPVGYLILMPIKISSHLIKYLDYWIGFYAFFIWSFINGLGNGKSAVNSLLVEPISILIFFILLSLTKTIIFKFYKKIPYKMVSIIGNVSLIIFVIILGLFCPTFPE